MSGGGREKEEKKREDEYRRQALALQERTTAAIEQASKPTSFETTRSEYAGKLGDWLSGKAGPIDVRKMPGGMADLALAEQAKLAQDAGRIGRGYGTMGEGANANYVAKLGQEAQLQRDLAAAGALEGNVNRRIAEGLGEGYNLANMIGSRTMGLAGLESGREENAQSRYLSYLMRPKQPSFLKQLAMSAVSGAAGMGANMLTGGMSSIFGGAARAGVGAGGGGLARIAAGW
jgi:hypothetical protein